MRFLRLERCCESGQLRPTVLLNHLSDPVNFFTVSFTEVVIRSIPRQSCYVTPLLTFPLSATVQGQPAFNGIDLIALTGAVIHPIILTAPAVVTNGVVTIEFSEQAIINALYIRPSLPTGPPLAQGPGAAPLGQIAPAPAPLLSPHAPAPAPKVPPPAPAPAPAPLKAPAPAPAPNYGISLAIDVGEPNANYRSTSVGLNFAADTVPCMVGVGGNATVPVGQPFCWANAGNVEGGFYRVPANAPISNTTDPTLYQTAR
jgi:hypothetical protein